MVEKETQRKDQNAAVKRLGRLLVNLGCQLDCLWNQLGMPMRDVHDQII